MLGRHHSVLGCQGCGEGVWVAMWLFGRMKAQAFICWIIVSALGIQAGEHVWAVGEKREGLGKLPTLVRIW